MAEKLRENWFYLLLPLLLLVSFNASRMPEALAQPQLLEGILLFDALVSLPLLYFLFLRSRFPIRQVALRCLAIALAGIWFAGWLMPEGEGAILPWLSWVRMLALPILIIIELVAFIGIIRLVFHKDQTPDALIAKGIPEPVAKLMILEARFWRWLFTLFFGKDKRR